VIAFRVVALGPSHINDHSSESGSSSGSSEQRTAEKICLKIQIAFFRAHIKVIGWCPMLLRNRLSVPKLRISSTPGIRVSDEESP